MFHSWASRPEVKQELSSGSRRPRKTNRTRTRTGCFTCRKRRLKCDEGRPTCQHCTRSKLSCTYGLKLTWEEDAISRGKCHGRKGVWSKTARKSEKHSKSSVKIGGSLIKSPAMEMTSAWSSAIFTNMTTNDMRLYYSDQVGCGSPEVTLPNFESGTFPQIGSIGNRNVGATPENQIIVHLGLSGPSTALRLYPSSRKFSDLEATLLSYYERELAPSAVLVGNEINNPCCSIILPMACRSELAYYGVLMSAAHALRTANPVFKVVELQLEQVLLKGLMAALRYESWEWEDVMIPAIQLCSFSVCGI